MARGRENFNGVDARSCDDDDDSDDDDDDDDDDNADTNDTADGDASTARARHNVRPPRR